MNLSDDKPSENSNSNQTSLGSHQYNWNSMSTNVMYVEHQYKKLKWNNNEIETDLVPNSDYFTSCDR